MGGDVVSHVLHMVHWFKRPTWVVTLCPIPLRNINLQCILNVFPQERFSFSLRNCNKKNKIERGIQKQKENGNTQVKRKGEGKKEWTYIINLKNYNCVLNCNYWAQRQNNSELTWNKIDLSERGASRYCMFTSLHNSIHNLTTM